MTRKQKKQRRLKRENSFQSPQLILLCTGKIRGYFEGCCSNFLQFKTTKKPELAPMTGARAPVLRCILAAYSPSGCLPQPATEGSALTGIHWETGIRTKSSFLPIFAGDTDFCSVGPNVLRKYAEFRRCQRLFVKIRKLSVVTQSGQPVTCDFNNSSYRSSKLAAGARPCSVRYRERNYWARLRDRTHQRTSEHGRCCPPPIRRRASYGTSAGEGS